MKITDKELNERIVYVILRQIPHGSSVIHRILFVLT